MAGREKPRPGVADVMRTTCDAMQSVDGLWAEDEIVGDVRQILGLKIRCWWCDLCREDAGAESCQRTG